MQAAKCQKICRVGKQQWEQQAWYTGSTRAKSACPHRALQPELMTALRCWHWRTFLG